MRKERGASSVYSDLHVPSAMGIPTIGKENHRFRVL